MASMEQNALQPQDMLQNRSCGCINSYTLKFTNHLESWICLYGHTPTFYWQKSAHTQFVGHVENVFWKRQRTTREQEYEAAWRYNNNSGVYRTLNSWYMRAGGYLRVDFALSEYFDDCFLSLSMVRLEHLQDDLWKLNTGALWQPREEEM